MSKFQFNQRAKNAREKMKGLALKIGNVAVKYTQEVIFPAEAFDGKSWKPPVKETGRPLLRKTDKMFNSVRVLRHSSRAVRWGTTVKYAKYHNTGTKNLPRRRFIGVDRSLRRIIRKQISSSMKTMFKR